MLEVGNNTFLAIEPAIISCPSEKLHSVMFSVKTKAAANIGVPDSELEEARSICKDIQRRKDLVSKMRKVR